MCAKHESPGTVLGDPKVLTEKALTAFTGEPPKPVNVLPMPNFNPCGVCNHRGTLASLPCPGCSWTAGDPKVSAFAKWELFVEAQWSFLSTPHQNEAKKHLSPEALERLRALDSKRFS